MKRLLITATYDAPGRGPAGLAWDGHSLWNADYSAGTIFQIDPNTGKQIGSLICPGNLSGLTWDGHSLWQSLHDAGWVRCINPQTNDFDRTVVVSNHGWLSGVAWDGTQLWAVSQRNGQLLALDVENSSVIRSIPAPVAGGGLDYHAGFLWLGIAYPMVFDEKYEQFDWVGDERHFAVLQLDPIDGHEIARFPLDFLPMGLAWADNKLWLIHSGRRNLHRAHLG